MLRAAVRTTKRVAFVLQISHNGQARNHLHGIALVGYLCDIYALPDSRPL